MLFDSNQTIKIVDFVLSKSYTDSLELLNTPCGSPCYAAPELIAGKPYSGLFADIWSSGIILFAMLCGYLPFEEENTTILYQKILNGEVTYPGFLSEEAKDLLSRVLQVDANNRANIEEIKSHKWYVKYNDEKTQKMYEITGVIDNQVII